MEVTNSRTYQNAVIMQQQVNAQLAELVEEFRGRNGPQSHLQPLHLRMILFDPNSTQSSVSALSKTHVREENGPDSTNVHMESPSPPDSTRMDTSSPPEPMYDTTNGTLVRSKTLVKGAIVSVDAVPFREWYETYYALPLARKKNAKISEEDSAVKKRSNHTQKKYTERQKTAAVDALLIEQFNTGRLLTRISSSPGQVGQANGYILEGKELDFYLRKIFGVYLDTNNQLVCAKTLVKGAIVSVDAVPFREWYESSVDDLLIEQFNTGRLLTRISSSPGQVGQANGYILEGKELDFYLRKIFGVYLDTNNQLVCAKTLVKGAIVSVDAVPFREWYETYYALPLARKKNAKISEEDSAVLNKKRSNHTQKKYTECQKTAAVDALLIEQFNTGRLLARISSSPGQVGQANGYILQENEFYRRNT